jgi:cation transport regulator ChaB
MSYDVKNPPEAISGLPAEAQAIWIEAFNATYKKAKDDKKASIAGWSAVKSAGYEKDGEGNWAKMAASDDLPTVNLKGVEILAVGTWSGSKEATYTKEDLDGIVDAFKALTGDPKLNYEAPAKLGHDGKQKLLQSDGYPAAGWVASLKRKGDKLVADFKNVPAKIGALIDAGGYKKVSSEIYQDYEMGGKVYPLVLKAVSFLGGDIPAVKTIKDILATYKDESGARFIVVEYSESLDRRVSVISDAFHKATRPPSLQQMPEGEGWLKEIFDTYVIVDKDGLLWQVPYVEQDGVIAFDFAGVVQVEQVYQPIAAAKQVGEGQDKVEESEESMKKVLVALGLSDSANEDAALAAVTALKAKADKVTTLSEQAQTALTEKARADGLATQLAERDAHAAVEKAITDGKIPPAEREYWQGQASKDLAGFTAFMEKKAKVVEFKEKGKETNAEVITLNEVEKQTAKSMGVTEAEFIAQKQKDSKGGTR